MRHACCPLTVVSPATLYVVTELEVILIVPTFGCFDDGISPARARCERVRRKQEQKTLQRRSGGDELSVRGAGGRRKRIDAPARRHRPRELRALQHRDVGRRRVQRRRDTNRVDRHRDLQRVTRLRRNLERDPLIRGRAKIERRATAAQRLRARAHRRDVVVKPSRCIRHGTLRVCDGSHNRGSESNDRDTAGCVQRHASS